MLYMVIALSIKVKAMGLWLMYQMILDDNKALPLILLFSGR